jgi:hypothetical protein
MPQQFQPDGRSVADMIRADLTSFDITRIAQQTIGTLQPGEQVHMVYVAGRTNSLSLAQLSELTGLLQLYLSTAQQTYVERHSAFTNSNGGTAQGPVLFVSLSGNQPVAVLEYLIVNERTHQIVGSRSSPLGMGEEEVLSTVASEVWKSGHGGTFNADEVRAGTME